MPGLLADVLPDKYGNALINTWLLNNGRAANSMNPVELLCFIGKRGMGALEFEPVMPRANNQSTKIELDKLIEIAYHLMAKEIGINMMECKLLEENGRAHFMTKRFDRTKNNNKIHVQSFCALNHFDFNEVNSFSYEQLFQTMRSLRLPYPDAEQLYKRMAFNVMARNCDDHTKNFSFIMNQSGDWSLAPAFDICHAYRPNSTWVSQHALSVNGKRNNITTDDLLAVAKNMNIKKPAAILNQISNTVKSWKDFATETKVKPKLRDAIGETLVLL